MIDKAKDRHSQALKPESDGFILIDLNSY